MNGNDFFLDLCVIIFAYLLGSLSSAIITCKLMALPDPRTLGSRNPGATNVLRIGNKKGKIAAAITLLGDSLKGFVPVLLAQLLQLESLIIAIVGFAAFLGHLYPVFFSFKGGKGVATAFGLTLALNPWVGLGLLASWLFVAFGLKISSLSALITAVIAPVLFLWLEPQSVYFYLSLVISILLIYRHKQNIQNLLKGQEGKIQG